MYSGHPVYNGHLAVTVIYRFDCTRALVARNFNLFYFILEHLLLSIYFILNPCCSRLFEISALVATNGLVCKGN